MIGKAVPQTPFLIIITIKNGYFILRIEELKFKEIIRLFPADWPIQERLDFGWLFFKILAELS